MRLVPLAAALAAGFAPMAQADTHNTRWLSGPTEFEPLAAWVYGQAPNILAELEVYCRDGQALMRVSDGQMLAHGRSGVVAITVDGRRMERPARYDGDGAEPGWLFRLDDGLAQALGGGARASATTQDMSDAVFTLSGSSAALATALAACPPPPIEALAPAAPAPATPPAAPDGLTVAFIAARAHAACEGMAAFGPRAVFQLDADGDGADDFLLNWGDVTCPEAPTVGQQGGAGFCGAATCSVDVFLSSRFDPAQPTQSILAAEVSLGPVGDSHPIRTVGRNGEVKWGWDGETLQSIP